MNINPNQLNLINSLMADSPFKPFRYAVMSGKEKEINKFWQVKIFENLKKSPVYLIKEMSGNSMQGFILINKLDWDSKIFNLKMAAINEFVLNPQCSKKEWIADQLLEKAVIKAKEEGYQFLLCKTYTDDTVSIHALEKAGFLLVDTLLDYYVDFRKVIFNKISFPEVADEIIIRFAKEEDGEELAVLARAAFANHFGRYHSDPRIQKELATQTYVEWMNSSLHGYADYFVLAEINHRIAGLSIWKKTSELEKNLPIRLGHYSIGAIHPDFYGKKLFSVLTYEGMKLLQPEIDLIEGPTHINNYAVQRGYNRLGWQIGDARHSFHKWLD
jgi:GNAT superfamily N-acetyltransferase